MWQNYADPLDPDPDPQHWSGLRVGGQFPRLYVCNGCDKRPPVLAKDRSRLRTAGRRITGRRAVGRRISGQGTAGRDHFVDYCEFVYCTVVNVVIFFRKTSNLNFSRTLYIYKK